VQGKAEVEGNLFRAKLKVILTPGHGKVFKLDFLEIFVYN